MKPDLVKQLDIAIGKAMFEKSHFMMIVHRKSGKVKTVLPKNFLG